MYFLHIPLPPPSNASPIFLSQTHVLFHNYMVHLVLLYGLGHRVTIWT